MRVGTEPSSSPFAGVVITSKASGRPFGSEPVRVTKIGVIDGVVTPWGELERYTLSVPLAVSCALIFVNTALDLGKAWAGIPEPVASHRTDPDA